MVNITVTMKRSIIETQDEDNATPAAAVHRVVGR